MTLRWTQTLSSQISCRSRAGGRRSGVRYTLKLSLGLPGPLGDPQEMECNAKPHPHCNDEGLSGPHSMFEDACSPEDADPALFLGLC